MSTTLAFTATGLAVVIAAALLVGVALGYALCLADMHRITRREDTRA